MHSSHCTQSDYLYPQHLKTFFLLPLPCLQFLSDLNLSVSGLPSVIVSNLFHAPGIEKKLTRSGIQGILKFQTSPNYYSFHKLPLFLHRRQALLIDKCLWINVQCFGNLAECFRCCISSSRQIRYNRIIRDVCAFG